jgi:hypothetical protein
MEENPLIEAPIPAIDAEPTSFFISKNEGFADQLFDVDTLMKADAEYYAPRFDAIKELREQDDGTLHRGNEFRRVASLVNVPMFQAVKLLDPEWMKDKKKFYAWLKRHPEYKTYDNRGGSRPSVTVVDGKAM